MPTLLSIGDFSRMTYLTVKALRLYHERGLLAPVQVDPSSGYRYYSTDQVPIAQVIRRLRDLGMPLEELAEVVHAERVTDRNRAILAHLQRLHDRLAQTQASVASLQALLEKPRGTQEIGYRSVPATPVVAVIDHVAMTDVGNWWSDAFAELDSAVNNAAAAGVRGALYSAEFFEAGRGEVVAFRPVRRSPARRGRVQPLDVPAAELAVALHRGSFDEIDRTYAALGTHVAERELGVDGPIREYYLVSEFDTDNEAAHRTEVCWPIFRTRS
ncbi:MerR family transcriptional regulator [Modestobacter marinus] [Mycobacterium shimoidei]|uniref:MerR family transcriptional regulator [Modestobacter marinus] n=1 Tax=Mycobacterium shimoidei TaxID=29313 RepID=A0A375YYU4_MYCSH|nr:MerR family transcriptional regulator [Mycobacterium shimoidei]SRX94026.1 MerR family transcriptional regulator [Modestobacter marinus] [Mycobacterium shimoidei]